MLDIREHFRIKTKCVEYFLPDTEREASNYFLPDGDLVLKKPSRKVSCGNAELIEALEEAQALVNNEIIIDERTYDKIGFRSNENEEEKRKLFDLYILYLCYCKIVWDEEPENQICKSYIWNNYGFGLNTFLDCCWALVECRISDGEIPQFMLHVDMEKHELIESIYCDNKYSALQALLLEHIRMGEQGRDGGEIAKCTCCGKEFVKLHGNAKLCAVCRKNDAKCKAYKIRKKARVENATESNS